MHVKDEIILVKNNSTWEILEQYNIFIVARQFWIIILGVNRKAMNKHNWEGFIASFECPLSKGQI